MLERRYDRNCVDAEMVTVAYARSVVLCRTNFASGAKRDPVSDAGSVLVRRVVAVRSKEQGLTTCKLGARFVSETRT